MNFLDNLLRYPIFFVSSMIGLVSIMLGPLLKLMKEVPNKTLTTLILLISLTSFFWILKQMLNLE